ncbi:MAG: PUA domain-containing protein [Pyrobaculum sp.]
MLAQVVTLLSYLYGREVVEKIAGRNIEVEYNKQGRIRKVYIDGKLAFVLRNNDGYLLPTLYGALFIDKKVIVSEEVAEYIRQGRNIPAKYVTKTVGGLRANGEVAVETPGGEVIAVGRLIYSINELSLGRGYAVRVRESAKQRREPLQ